MRWRILIELHETFKSQQTTHIINDNYSPINAKRNFSRHSKFQTFTCRKLNRFVFVTSCNKTFYITIHTQILNTVWLFHVTKWQHGLMLIYFGCFTLNFHFNCKTSLLFPSGLLVKTCQPPHFLSASWLLNKSISGLFLHFSSHCFCWRKH